MKARIQREVLLNCEIDSWFSGAFPEAFRETTD
jgi:hypothetical protein